MLQPISRRDFIRLGYRSAGAIALSNIIGPLAQAALLQAATADYKALVCIFLFGGNDSNNMIVPLDSRYDQYLTARKDLALSKTELIRIADGDGTPYGVHPKLAEIARLYNTGAATCIFNVGPLVKPTTRADYNSDGFPLPWNLFSHEQQQIQWQSGIPSLSTQPTGWAGRMADDLVASGLSGGSLPIGFSVAAQAVGDPVILTGETTNKVTVFPGAAMALSGTGNGDGARLQAMNRLLTLDEGFSLVQSANQLVADAISKSSVLGAALAKAPPLPVTFPDTLLGRQLKQIAEIIRARSAIEATRQIFFAVATGFDTHFHQLVLQSEQLQEVSAALDAFHRFTVADSIDSQITTFTMSEFNRTFQSNSLGGSDHGWGGHHLVVGGAVNGRQLYGRLPELALGGDDDTDSRGRWIPQIAIDQYAATLGSWFGLSVSQLNGIFPNLKNFGVSNLGFLR